MNLVYGWPKRSRIVQGPLGDCYLIPSLATPSILPGFHLLLPGIFA